ncbi:Protein Lines-like [Stylophora pistillata]|uniref:Protein Lines-like n=1 Tax=Stylophora pistillata TaxID=50429 RepID=A0A2B4T0V7_STYPI|nr:Protein Lines-like [Stylophora pistillata]
MDKIEELYFKAFTYNCFKEVCAKEIWWSLKNWLQIPETSTIENAVVDTLLLAMTVVQKLYQRFETVHCPYLRVITNDLVSKYHLFDCLLELLGDSNQYVVFSATKGIVLIFQVVSKQIIKGEWFLKLFNFGKETEYPWKKLYVMEMLQKIIRNARETPKNPENYQQRVEGTGGNNCSCTTAQNNLTDSRLSTNELVEVLLRNVNLQHILFLYVPFIVRPNGIHSFMKNCQCIGLAEDLIVLQASLKLGDGIHEQENMKKEAIFGAKEKNLVAFLHSMAEIAKYVNFKFAAHLSKSRAELKNSIKEQSSLLRSKGFGSTDCSRHKAAKLYEWDSSDVYATRKMLTDAMDDTVNQLCIVASTLTQYLHHPRLPPLIFKKILEILYHVLFIPSLVLFTHENKCAKLHKVLRSPSVSFLSVVECCLLARIPRGPGTVRFSATAMESPSGCAGQTERMDLIALRKASLMVFKSAFIVLKSAVQQEGSFLFQKLSLSCMNLWCRELLSLTSGNPFDSKSSMQNFSETELCDCVMTLFVDQDDELVESMLALLLIFQELHRTTVKGSTDLEVKFTERALHPTVPVVVLWKIRDDHSSSLKSVNQRFVQTRIVQSRIVEATNPLGEMKATLTLQRKHLVSYEFNQNFSSSEIATNILRQLNPHWLFAAFTESVQFDPSLLLDLLISSETRFLEYLTKYLRFVVSDWGEFTQSLATYRRIDGEEDKAIHGELEICGQRRRDCEKSEEDVVSLLDISGAQMLKTFPSSQMGDDQSLNNHNCIDTISKNSSETRSVDRRLGTDNSDYIGGLKNIVQSYCSSGESDVEIEGESESSETTADCVFEGFHSCELHSMTFNNNSAETFDSSVANANHIERVTDKSCEVLDKVMTMLIRVRLSVGRLTSGGHFPYNAVPLIALMENVEKFYDGC